MNLDYNDEQNMLREQIQKFCESEYDFYKREEIKKTHGVTIDGFGNVIKKKNQGHQGHLGSSRRGGTQMKDKRTANRNFKSTADYKSSGLIYDDNLLKNMNNLF